MCNQDDTFPFLFPSLHFLCKNTECIDIESCIDLIEKYVLRIEKSDLEKFDFSFFSSRKSYIEITLEECWIDRKFSTLSLEKTSEEKR